MIDRSVRISFISSFATLISSSNSTHFCIFFSSVGGVVCDTDSTVAGLLLLPVALMIMVLMYELVNMTIDNINM